MNDQTTHVSLHLFGYGHTNTELDTYFARIKQGIKNGSATAWKGPNGKIAQLAVQVELSSYDYASNPNSALSELKRLLDRCEQQGFAVHLLLAPHYGAPSGWQKRNWALWKDPKAHVFMPFQPLAKAPSDWDVLFANFTKPVIEDLNKNGYLPKLAVIYILNEFVYRLDGQIPSQADAEAMAYTAGRGLDIARTAAAGKVPVGLKLIDIKNPKTGWGVLGKTDQLSWLIRDVIAKNKDVLGYDAYFAQNGYDKDNLDRLKPYTSALTSGQLEISEYGRICSGKPGSLTANQTTSANEIRQIAEKWNMSRSFNLFAWNATGEPAGCHALWVNNNYGPGATDKLKGLWDQITMITGNTSPLALN